MKLGLPILPFRRSNLPSPAKPTFSPPAAAAPKEHLVVIMGATGAGKSRLSIDLATRFSGEIINADKIQLYKGLNITTNKIPIADRAAVPHHLLGEFPSAAGGLPSSVYRRHAAAAVSDILSRRRLPFLVGGSNSLIHALLSGRNSDPFSGEASVCSISDLRYRCCFLWVDVSPEILNNYLDKRVDEMLDSGMIEELSEFYSSEIGNSPAGKGVRKAIGVPEFERYFRLLPSATTSFGGGCSDRVRRGVYEDAVRSIKENTRQLAKRQMEKIERLRKAGWSLRRLDGSDSFRRVVEGSDGWEGAWEREVVGPSVSIVQRFLEK